MERYDEENIKYLEVGFPLFGLGLIGAIAVVFGLIIPDIFVFLLLFYLCLISFSFGIISILKGIDKISLMKSKLIMVSIIFLGGFTLTLILDYLVHFLFLVL